MDLSQGGQSLAQAGDVGEMFRYQIASPVKLERSKSAMLPIVNESVSGDKVSIYNEGTHAKHPLNGLRLKNTTDKHLLQGPITVLDANTYAGDAQIDNLPPGQERLLSYGIDLQMLVDATKNTSRSSILTGKIVKGVLQISRKHVATQDYTGDNKSDKDKTLIIEHPIKQNWKLVDTDKPMETTQTLYRFNVVAAGLFTHRAPRVVDRRLAWLESICGGRWGVANHSRRTMTLLGVQAW